MVGIGPGSSEYLSFAARKKIKEADVVVGYTTYINLIEPELLKNKEVISSGMRTEIKRCEIALERAREGKNVVLISSGDPGIYGMAGPMLEVLKCRGEEIKVEIIPGIPAFCAASAIVGAPVMHDFVVISLSDILTPWDLIRKRIVLALEGDFVIVIYNPRSRHRTWQLKEVIDIIVKFGKQDLPVAVIKNATRNNQEVFLTTVKELNVEKVDMVTVVIIGNSSSKVYKRWFITPRGYRV